jgi:hypothetical protein
MKENISFTNKKRAKPVTSKRTKKKKKYGSMETKQELKEMLYITRQLSESQTTLPEHP